MKKLAGTNSPNSVSEMEKKRVFEIMRLLEVNGIGPSRINRMLDEHLYLNNSLLAMEDQIETGLVEMVRHLLTDEQFLDYQNDDSKYLKLWSDLKDENVNIISKWDEEYPRKVLRYAGSNSPPLLYYMGNVELLGKSSVGFCGSRRASKRGLEVAQDCSAQLSKKGVSIVSGYAQGVDIITHRTALEGGGTIIVVLAEGILNFRVKKTLKELWTWEKALVISQFHPDRRWSVGNAMTRNKTLCSLSDAMVLIESGLSGGSMDAGKTCLKMGLPLFAPVYEGMPRSASGNFALLKEGAKPFGKNPETNRANVNKIFESIGLTEVQGRER